MSNVLHHRSVRKRIYKNLEPYPHPSFYKRLLDIVVYIAGFLGPLFTGPQIYVIFSTHNASGVSVLTWSIYALLDTVWILYGIVHKENLITFTYTLWFVMNTLVAAGAVIYHVS